jgi:hypothetical protein
MKCNMSPLDRILRLVLAVAVAVLFVTHQLTGIAAIILGVLAVIFFLTAVIGVCPIYSIFDLSTRKSCPAEKPKGPEGE